VWRWVDLVCVDESFVCVCVLEVWFGERENRGFGEGEGSVEVGSECV
jgi:hypothetical protein